MMRVDMYSEKGSESLMAEMSSSITLLTSSLDIFCHDQNSPEEGSSRPVTVEVSILFGSTE